MNIYIMRHGLTNWNEKHICQGRSQNQLSKTGKSVTLEVAIKNKNLKIDAIYVSPLMRTMQTANIMNKYHNVKIIKDDRLIEIDQGIFTGRVKADLTDEEQFLRKNKDASCGMESYDSVISRANDFVKFLKTECVYENILIITHSMPATFIYYILSGIDVNSGNIDNLRHFDNSEIRHINIEK